MFFWHFNMQATTAAYAAACCEYCLNKNKIGVLLTHFF